MSDQMTENTISFGEQADMLVALITKDKRTYEEEEKAKKIVRVLFLGARTVGEGGEKASEGLSRVAEACASIGAYVTAIAFWDRLVDIGDSTRNRTLYYRAMDAIDALRTVSYEEHHPKSA